MAEMENENSTASTENATPPAQEPAQQQPQQEQQTSATDKQTSGNETETGGLIYPADGSDSAAVLNFRKSCGYPDDAAGYGLPMDTDEQKSLVNFIHKCQLDPIAAKTVADNVAAVLAEQDKADRQKFTDDYNKVVGGWGESRRENESLMNKGMSLLKIDGDKLRGISDTLGVEAALSMMMLVGKSQTDYSGVTGGNSEDNESLLGYISRKRG